MLKNENKICRSEWKFRTVYILIIPIDLAIDYL